MDLVGAVLEPGPLLLPSPASGEPELPPNGQWDMSALDHTGQRRYLSSISSSWLEEILGVGVAGEAIQGGSSLSQL